MRGLFIASFALAACADDRAAAERYRAAFCGEVCRSDPTLAGCRACPDAGTGGGAGAGGGSAAGGSGGGTVAGTPHLFLFGLDAGAKVTRCTPVRLGVVDDTGAELSWPDTAVTLQSAFFDPGCSGPVSGAQLMQTGGLPLGVRTSTIGRLVASVDGGALGMLVQPIDSWGQLTARLDLDGGTCVGVRVDALVPDGTSTVTSFLNAASAVYGNWGFGSDGGVAPFFSDSSCASSGLTADAPATFWVLRTVPEESDLVLEGPWLHRLHVSLTSPGSSVNGTRCTRGNECQSRLCASDVCQCIAAGARCEFDGPCCNSAVCTLGYCL